MIEMFLQINISFEKEFVDGWGGDQWLIMYNFDNIYLYTEDWVLLEWEVIIQLSSDIVAVYFYLFYNGPVDMQIWTLLTKSQCSVFDTQLGNHY